MNEFEKEFSEELKGLDFLQKKKLEYEFNRWKNGLGRKIKLSENEILTLNYIKEKARKR
jgi:hypothetical protein